MADLSSIRLALKHFVRERDWEQFHAPKNLVMALAGETGELIEQFQWLTAEQSDRLSPERLNAVADEIADIQLYLVLLADRLGLDLFAECERKMRKNAEKYPLESSKGQAEKVGIS